MLLLVMTGCTGKPPAIVPTESTAPPKLQTPDVPPAITLMVDGQSSNGGRIPAGKHVVRLEFTEPANRNIARLYEGAPPLTTEWAADDRWVSFTFELKHGEWVQLNTREIQTKRGPVFPEAYLKLQAVGKIGVWRQDPGGVPVRVATMDDTAERLYAAPGGQVLAFTEVAELGYMDFYKVGLIDPVTGALRYADIPVNDVQAVQNPRWWSGGMLIAGISWGIHRVDWTGADQGEVPAVQQGSWVRGTGMSPAGEVAVLISGQPERGKQMPADLVVGKKVYRGITMLPMWPENRGDTHYWPHLELLWLGEEQVVVPDLASHFGGAPREWLRVDLKTGETQPFPLLQGHFEAVPSNDRTRMLARDERGWSIVQEGRAPVRIQVTPTDQRGAWWAPPVWSKDGKVIYWGPLTVDPDTGAVTTAEIPPGTHRVARDASGRIYWLGGEPSESR